MLIFSLGKEVIYSMLLLTEVEYLICSLFGGLLVGSVSFWIEGLLVFSSGKEEVVIIFSVFSFIGIWVLSFSVLSTMEVFSTFEGFVILSIFSFVM